MDATLTWLGQGGFLLEKDGERLIIDPYLSDLVERQSGPRRLVPPPIAPGDLRGALTVITHDHNDHLDTDTLSAADDGNAVFAGPPSCVAHMRAIGVSEDCLRPLGRGDALSWGGFAVRGVHAEHTEDSIGVFVMVDGLNVYFTADSLDSPLLRDAGRGADMLIVCVNGRWGNMGHEEAARLALDLRVACAVPTHYGMFAENTADPQDFVRALSGAGINTPVLAHATTYPLRAVLEGTL
jgi:L-ascorbate metabolism protein UlaG (beta-lactamase superfamily)